MEKSFEFTHAKLAKTACEATKNQTLFWDADVKGLGLRVTKGGSKSFFYQNRLHGQSIRMTIGDFSIGCKVAQDQARLISADFVRGIDPRKVKADKIAKSKAARTKGQQALVAWDEYIHWGANRPYKPWGERHKADHISMVKEGGKKITRGLRPKQRKFEQDGILRPLLMLPLNAITREEVKHWIKKEAKQRPARTRLALAQLRAFINWAGDHKEYKALVDKSACERMTKELPEKIIKEDCLDKEQLNLWFKGVKQIGNPIINAYLQILLITGARRNELATLKWADVDIQWHTATIRDKVEGERKIPLTPYVELLINRLPKIAKQKDGTTKQNTFVFSSSSAKSGRLEEPSIAHKQAMEDAGLTVITLHGLRRSFATLSEWVECPVGICAQIMGHKPSGTAEKHYKKRPISLLRQWHTKIEKFILDEAGIPQPKEGSKRLRVVNSK